MRVFAQVEVRGHRRLAQAAFQEAGLAVQRAARGGLHEGAEQPGGQRSTRTAPAPRRWRPCATPAATAPARRHSGRPLRAPRGRGRRASSCTSSRAACRVRACRWARRDRRHRQRVPRTGIAAAKAARVAHEEMRLLGTHAGTLGIGDAPIGAERRRFAAQRQRSRRLGIDGPGMEQVEVALGRSGAGQVGRVGQAGRRVLGREARNVVGRLHRLLDRRARKVRRAGIATALADIDGDAERLVAIALDVLEFAHARRHRQAHPFRHLGAGIAGTGAAAHRQRVFDDLPELVAGVGKAGVSCHVGLGPSSRAANYHTEQPLNDRA